MALRRDEAIPRRGYVGILSEGNDTKLSDFLTRYVTEIAFQDRAIHRRLATGSISWRPSVALPGVALRE